MNRTPDLKKQTETTTLRRAFSQVPHWFCEVPKSVLSFPERNLLLWYGSHDPSFKPCQSTYAKVVGLSTQAVSTSNSALRKKGFIVDNGVNRYKKKMYRFVGWEALHDLIYPPESNTSKLERQKSNTRKLGVGNTRKLESKNNKGEEQTKNIVVVNYRANAVNRDDEEHAKKPTTIKDKDFSSSKAKPTYTEVKLAKLFFPTVDDWDTVNGWFRELSLEHGPEALEYCLRLVGEGKPKPLHWKERGWLEGQIAGISRDMANSAVTSNHNHAEIHQPN